MLNEIEFLRKSEWKILKVCYCRNHWSIPNKNLAYKSTDNNFLDVNSAQFNICSNDDSPKRNSQSKKTADEKTSNEYSDDELINFNLVSTATNAANLSSINKNNSNASDITMLMKKKQ